MEEGEPKTYHEEEEEVKDEVDPMIEENFQFENLTVNKIFILERIGKWRKIKLDRKSNCSKNGK